MARESNKKLLILYVWDILKEFSDENHLLTQNDIAIKIYQIYGMECERKAVGANIDALIDFGVDIIKVSHKGCFIGQRQLETSEVSYIIDAIFSSRAINGRHAKELSEKISKVLSKHQRRKYNYIYKSDHISRSNKSDLFLNVEIIQEAIEKRKKISFKYVRFSNDNKKDKIHVVSPYFLMNSQGRYYLICNNEYFDETSTYKMDLISNVNILNDDAKPISNLKGFEKGIDCAEYINEHVYAFGKESVQAKLKLLGEHAISFIYDWFGNDCRIYKNGNDLYADINSNEQALIYWCLQYCDHIEIVSPSKTREKVIDKLSNAMNRYKGAKSDE